MNNRGGNVAKKPEKKVRVPQKHGGVLTPVQKGEVLNPEGRPKSHLKKVTDELNLLFETDQINKVTVRALLSQLAYLPQDRLNILAKDEQMPMAVRMFVRSMMSDWNSSQTGSVKGLISFDMQPEDDKGPKKSSSLSSFTVDQVFIGVKHGINALPLAELEKINELLQLELQKKRAGEARTINQ